MSDCTLFERFVAGVLSVEEHDIFIEHHHTCDRCRPAIAQHRRQFVAGELSEAAAERFREHLLDCPVCDEAILDDFEAEMALGEAGLVLPPDTPEGARPSAFPRWASLGVLALSAAAAIMLVVTIGDPAGPDLGEHLGETRALEARFSDPGADRYRPYDVAMSAGTAEAEPLPLSVLAALEEAGDPNRLAAGLYLSGNAVRARQILEAAPDNADTLSDRAVLALEAGAPREALRWASEALRLEPSHPQARWNRAIALRRLELPLASAAGFRAISLEEEADWGAEALRRADALQQGFDDHKKAYEDARAQARALAVAHTPPPLSIVDSHPSLARRAFYEATRTATAPGDLQAIRPLAAALDTAAGGAPLLEARLDAVAAGLAGNPARAALAEAYRALVAYDVGPGGVVQGTEPDVALWRMLLRSEEDDIALGALAQRQALYETLPEPHLQRYIDLASAHPDPWWQLRSAWLVAWQRYSQRDYSAALLGLEEPVRQCARDRGVEEPCLQLNMLHAMVLEQMGRQEESEAAVQRVLATATRIGELKFEGIVLWDRFASFSQNVESPLAPHLAAAYLDEVGLRGGDCQLLLGYDARILEAIARNDLAGVKQLQAASAALEGAQCPEQPTLPNQLAWRATLEHLAPLSDAEHAMLIEDITAFRASVAELPGGAVIADYLEGVAQIRRNPDAGRSRLEAVTAALSEGGAPQELRTAYSILADERAANEDAEAATRWMEAAAGLAAPTPCHLSIGSAVNTLVVSARDAAGEARSVRHTLPPAVAFVDVDKVVPAALQEHVSGCAQVAVSTDVAVYYGEHRLLSPELAWGFRSRRSSSEGSGDVPEHRLVVAALNPPAALGLPPLQAPTDTAGAQVLRDGAATPERVLSEMQQATLVEVYAHGLFAEDQSAAALVLSPGNDGFTLTAEDIRGISLPGQPLVLLVACHGSQTGDRAGGLGDAFLSAGARAVVASALALRSRAAVGAFATLRRDIAAGTPPAIALRDLRAAGVEGSDALVLFQ